MRSLPVLCFLAVVILGYAPHCSARRGLRQVISRQEIQQLFGMLPPPLQAPAPAPAQLTSGDPAASSSTSGQVSQDGSGSSPSLVPPISVTDVLGNSTATQQPVGIPGPTTDQSTPPWPLNSPHGVSSDPRTGGGDALFRSPSPLPAGASMAAVNSASPGLNTGALQTGIASPPAQSTSAGPGSQLTESAAILTPDAAHASTAMSPSPPQLPFGDKDPFGDAAASRGGAMPAAYQPHQTAQGHTPAPHQPNRTAPGSFSGLVADILGNAAATPPMYYLPASLPDQALIGSPSYAAAPSPEGAAALQPPLQPSAQLLEQGSAATASPADAAAPSPANPPPAPPPDQASQGGLKTSPAQPPSTPRPDSQQAGSVPDEDRPVQPGALPPVTGIAYSDQQPLLKEYQDRSDRWRSIAIAGIVLLMLLLCTILACGLCHLLLTRQLEQPAAKPARKGRYRGMQEFEMPEIKSNSWGMP